ncbi:MAG TPA: hypothetical protein VL282_13590 [Tepidisphaeraceae bacterium]|jgi:hypothetical protein|nr:hypothetical protein [Tepidisphaeraceae bacterium]
MRHVLILLTIISCSRILAADVYLRVRVHEPKSAKLALSVGGYRHEDPWYFTATKITTGAQWSEWTNLSDWRWHGRLSRAGGIAEWPTVTLTLDDPKIKGCEMEVQLADAPNDAGVVHAFSERSESGVIGFIVPTPLREHKDEFETGSQMCARQLKWAKEATDNMPVKLKQFQFISAIWGQYDPALQRTNAETLMQLGFNTFGADAKFLRQHGLRSYQTLWLYGNEPEVIDREWKKQSDAMKANMDPWLLREGTSHWVLGDEVSTTDPNVAKDNKATTWFREYLRAHHVKDGDLPRPIDQIEYPKGLAGLKSLPRDADLPTRRMWYYTAKFAQSWSADQLRHQTDLVHATFPGSKTETLPTDHGFLNAWGPPVIGMSYRLLDLFDLADKHAVDQLSAEDWVGLNHMYGPDYTWTGAQTTEYFSSICSSAIGDRDIHLRALITVSDDDYLRLKCYSAIAQGTKSFFFWTFGPTYIGTENYWSDLRSEYDGIARLGRALEKCEDLICAAQPVRDRVAIAYCVSHDLWICDNPAAFVEKRLTWHALRHEQIQPLFIREEEMASGGLKNIKVLYLNDWCVSRAASAAIDRWVKDGGVLYMSAGAATRDEFYEPYLPAFAKAVWPDDAAKQLVTESGHTYNERNDLPKIKPMAMAGDVPIIGCRMPLRAGGNEAIVNYGKGKVFAVGYMPGLAYGQGANFAPAELKEKWPDAPRAIIARPLESVRSIQQVRANIPVVEASLLTGPKGSAIVLANYTYQPIDKLVLDVHRNDISTATSVDGVPVKLEKTRDGIRLELPLKWTDFVILK